MTGPLRAAALAAMLAIPWLVACAPEGAASNVPERSAPSEPIGSGFDFFVLSLSWSPSYCTAEGDDANRFQCGRDRDFGFIVHGLWPQFEDGWPQDCDTGGEDRVPAALADSVSDIMPSRGLVGHQWRKHGSCTGLDQRAYLEATRSAFDAVTIPKGVGDAMVAQRIDAGEAEALFVEANPGLTRDGIAVSCADGRLDEVRICMTRDLAFRACPRIDARGCKRGGLLLPAAP